jgi:hypothetical protein
MANFLNTLIDTTNKLIDETNSKTTYNSDNILPSVPSADGNGLPFTKVINQRKAVGFKPNLITWYVPEFRCR